MAGYSSFRNFLEKIKNELGYEFFIQNGPNAQYTQIIFRKYSENLVLMWDVENNLLYSFEFDEKESESLNTLFFNKIFPANESKIDILFLRNYISQFFVLKTPDNKILSLLEYIRSQMTFDGDSISLDDKDVPLIDQYWRSLYFNSLDEFEFYMEAIQELGYVRYELVQGCYLDVRLTIHGLGQVVKLLNEKSSKTCFIAMSFDDDMFKVYGEAIRPAVIESGFEPLLISEKKDIPSDTTINDAILSAIRKSRFTIADFTRHKHGVYFESGYALGLGQKVIYTCSVEHIEKAHFDTRNYPHIVWKDAEDLRKKLIDKIEVFIKG